MPADRMWPIRRLQACGLLGAQREAGGGQRVLEVLLLRHPDGRRGHPRPGQQPGERDLGGRYSPAVRDRPYGVDDVEVGVVVERLAVRVAAGTYGTPLATAPPRTGQQPARERTPGDHAHALVVAEGDHLPLLLAVDEVVVALHRDERR